MGRIIFQIYIFNADIQTCCGGICMLIRYFKILGIKGVLHIFFALMQK